MKRTVTMRAALADPRLLGGALVGESWSTWRVFLIAAMGERLTGTERKVFRQFTGRQQEPGERVEEMLALVGRRGGKDVAASVLAAYLGGLVEWPMLRRGETGILLVLGADTRQAQIQRDYIAAVFDQSPMLSSLVANKTADTIELSNNVTIEVRAASFRRNRGMTCIGVIGTEFAFLLDENSANPDSEILNALRPTLSTTGGPLILITTPWASRGEVFNIYREHYGAAGNPRILVVQASTRSFNPLFSQGVIDRAMQRDPAAAAAEYGAVFRSDLEEYVRRSAVEAVVSSGVYERAPRPGVRYGGFCDASGGSVDAMTLAVGHLDENRIAVLDCLRRVVPPFSPGEICAQFASTLKSYNVHTIQSDKYAGAWVEEAFAAVGITCEQSADPKSALYTSFLPLINSARVSLLDDLHLVNELCGLERRTARGGRESIDHRPGAHDDTANCAAGCLVGLALEAAPLQWGGIAGELRQRAALGVGERSAAQRMRMLDRRYV